MAIKITIFAILVLAVFLVYAAWPYNKRKERMQIFKAQYIAHRGLYDNDGPAPENSMAAYEKAAEAGYGIELDVRMTDDCQMVCFHDPSLKRATGAEGSIEDHSLGKLLNLRLFNSREPIPIFWEVLQNIHGRVPLIVEIKAEKNSDIDQLCREVAFCLDAYEGDYCIESFHPKVVRWFRKNHPQVVRGQLTERFVNEGVQSFVLTWCLFNFLTKPDFIAYNKKDIHTKAFGFLRYVCGASMVGWTIHSAEEIEEMRECYDVFIFEHFTPPELDTAKKEALLAAAKGTVPMNIVRKHMFIDGRVQGVGFRYHSTYIAQHVGVTGWVRNLYDGRVEMEAQGTPEQIEEMMSRLGNQRYISITGVESTDVPPDPRSVDFRVKY